MGGGETTLQGRDAQLALLHGALDGALAGRGRLALLTGDAGIGKSALSAAVARAAEAKGALVTWGRAWEYADAPPYFPVWPCLRALGVEHDRTKSTEADAFHLWEHVLGRIGALPTERAQVWILEDLHAADLQTLDLLTFLAQPIRSARLLVVATARAKDPRLTDRMSQRLTRMAREGIDVRLDPLGDLEVAALAEQTLGRPLPAAAVKRLVETTRGNPLFVVECARSLEAGGAAALPPTVRQVVLERVALLDESTRGALSCGAILGREFAAATVARMRDVLPARVIDSLLPALRAGIVSESRPGHFVFSHTLVCEAIEDALVASDRSLLHARAVDALEPLGEGTDVLVERARHALLSQARGEEALALAARATKLLEGQGAFDRAFALHERMEDARRAGMGAASSAADRLHVARIADAAGRHADCQRIADEVIAVARAVGDAELFGAAVLLLGKALRPGVVVRSLVALLEEARARAAGTPPSLDARLLARLAAALQPHEDPDLPCAMAREAIAKARALGDDDVLLEVLETAGSALVDFAPIDERIERALELHERATKAGDKARTLRASLRLAMDWVGKGDFAAFDRELDRMMALSAELGHPRHRWRVLLTASMRAVTMGAFVESDRYVVEVQQLATLTDDPSLPLSLGAHELLRARVMRRDQDARALSDTANLLFVGVPETIGFSSLLRAAVFARMDDAAAVRAELAVMGRSPMMETDLTGRDWTAEAFALGGSDDDLRRIREIIAPLAGGESNSGHVGYTYDGPSAFYLAKVEGALGRHDRAAELLRGALGRAVARRHRTWIAILSNELGRVLEKLGDQESARRALEEALAIAEELPMPGLAVSLRERLAAQRGASAVPAHVHASSSATRVPLSLAREGDVWRVEQGALRVRVKDSRGMQLLARLVERPDEEIHVLVLAADEGGSIGETSAGDQLDERARREYRARLADLDGDIEEAERDADVGRVEKLRREADAIRAELARAVGLGGKARQAGSSTERARVNVQRRLKDAVSRIGEADGDLGRAFERAVKTGTFCCFRP